MEMGQGQEQTIHRKIETNSPQIHKKMLILTGREMPNSSYLQIMYLGSDWQKTRNFDDS